MKLDDLRESENVEDRRQDGGGSNGGGGGFSLPGGRGGLGLGGILIVLAISYFTGINPITLINGYQTVTQGTAEPQPTPRQQAAGQAGAPADAEGAFVAHVLYSTEETWTRIFQQQVQGADYVKPKLVLFAGYTQSGCGAAQSAMGPFYCPNDRLVYLDTEFFSEMRNRFNACPAQGACTFAEAYVIAHEVGHHVQNLLGILPKAHQAMQDAADQGGDQAAANAISVKIELQADCFAGIWANRTERSKHFLDPGDVEGALKAATAIGDDALQMQAQGHVVPDSFTHGTSAQRVRWLRRGLETGEVKACNTFEARDL